MARVLRLMLAASMLVLLAQIYLSSSLRASSPAAVPPSQSANVMPRVTLEGGSLCHAAPWSLAVTIHTWLACAMRPSEVNLRLLSRCRFLAGWVSAR